MTNYMTEFEQHVKEWSGCKRCDLCKTRKQVVHARGSIPADLVLCAEAPGVSEDVIGKPMVGPAGDLFDEILRRAIPKGITYLIANLVGCLPLDEEGKKQGQPPEEAIEACTPRLQHLIRMADPKLVVCVGAMARDWLTPGYKHSIKLHREIPRVEVIHPAAIIRSNYAMRGLAIQKAVVTISNAITEYVEPKE